MLNRLLAYLLGRCPHEHFTWPRRRNGIDVCICLTCGAEIQRLQFRGSRLEQEEPEASGTLAREFVGG